MAERHGRTRSAGYCVLGIVCLALSASGAQPSVRAPQDAPPAPGEPSPSPSAASTDAIFDQSRLHEIQLRMKPEDWAVLCEDYVASTFYPADLTIDGEGIAGIGVRARGDGTRNRRKPNLSLDIDRFTSGQEFLGYKKLVLNSDIGDPSGLRERLAFSVFEAMGIPAPRLAHARVSVNGNYWGVYALTEPIGKPFLKARLGEKDGILYDYEHAKKKYHFEYLGAKRKLYIPAPFRPRTHEDDLDPSGLIDFIRWVNEATDEDFAAHLASRLDPERFLTYVATENALAESDGMLGDWGVNNFYLYQHAGEPRFTLIPWDKDTSLQAAHWPLFRNMDQCVLTRRLMKIPQMRRVYGTAVKKAVTLYVNPHWLGQRLERAYAQVRAAELADRRKPQSNATFEDAITALRAIIASRQADVLKQIPPELK